MIGRLAALAALALIVIAPNTAAVSAEEFPDVVGLWAGTFNTAFSKPGKELGQIDHGAQMELDIVKQDKNLIWAKLRWRVKEGREWHDERTTGTFDLLERTKLNIVEVPTDDTVRGTGFYEGHVKDGKMYLTYTGIGKGISYAVILERK